MLLAVRARGADGSLVEPASIRGGVVSAPARRGCCELRARLGGRRTYPSLIAPVTSSAPPTCWLRSLSRELFVAPKGACQNR
jgi:hypothetical protein